MSDDNKTSTDTAAPKTGVDALDGIFESFDRTTTPGLVVGVAQHGKTLYRRGFGLASIEHAVANTPWTRMRIGSTSKHFTCLAAMLLAEDGKLDVDASVRVHVPELPLLAGEPTLRQLMSHVGGYRCYLDVGFLSDGMAIKPKGLGLASQIRQGDVNFKPGEKIMYNNGGYHLLSIVIERVSGMPFERFMKERVFAPLAMADTDSVPSDFEIVRGLATLHVPLPDGSYRRGIFPTEEVRGEGAMVSTVDDMLRWLEHLRGPKRVGNDRTWEQMITPARLLNGATMPYALGLMRHDYRGIEVIHHGGGVIGGTCQMITVPSHALDVIIITNGIKVSPADLANQVIDAMIGDAALGPAPVKAETDAYKALVGKRYRSTSDNLVVGFGDAGGKLGLSVFGMPPVPLRQEGDTLRLAFEDIAIGPITIAAKDLGDAAPATLSASESGNPDTLELLPKKPPSVSDVAPALIGRYHAADLAADAQIYLDGDKLKFKVLGDWAVNMMTLDPWAHDLIGVTFDAALLPLNAVMAVQYEGDRVKALRLSTLRSRRIRFERLPG